MHTNLRRLGGARPSVLCFLLATAGLIACSSATGAAGDAGASGSGGTIDRGAAGSGNAGANAVRAGSGAGGAASGGSSGAAGSAVGIGGAVAGTSGNQAGTGGSDARAGASGGEAAGSGGTAGVTAGGSGGTSSGRAGAGGGASGGMSNGGAGGALAATPPMGWNSWNTFQCNLSEKLIEQIADTLVSSGMAAAGYQYVNLDDCWMDGRDTSGALRWNASKFPSGIPALADYVHQKGLKIGIYETPNTSTCVGIYGGISKTVAVGSLGHEATDAKTFASWGIDYLKYDKCQGPLTGFATMRDALRATARPIFYSINPGDGTGCPPNSCSINLPSIANMWRIGFDINASWSSVASLIDQNANLYSYAAPGHWNDPDMMEVGNGLSDAEGRAHFSMWAIFAAPLIAGNDLRNMTQATKNTLTNTEVIAVDQDALGMQGRLVATPSKNLQVWSKPLTGTDARAVVLLNRNDSGSASITVQWAALGIPAGKATVRDLWNHSDLGSFTGSFTAPAVPSHGAVMLKIVSTQ